jgi:hypothetical protein
MFTFPSFRGQGYGSQIIAAGTAYIEKSDADIAMLYCDESLRDLYANQGWIHMDRSTSYIGTKEEPELVDDEILMMLFLSPKGQHGQAAFNMKPIHFSLDYTWYLVCKTSQVLKTWEVSDQNYCGQHRGKL